MKKIDTVTGNALFLNGLALTIAIIAYLFIYRGLWQIIPPAWAKVPAIIYLIFLAVGILLLHEAIHMLTANLLTGGAGATLRVRALTWECRLKIPLRRNHYIAYALAPGITLSLLGFVLYYAFSDPGVKFLCAIAFIAAISSAGGDYWFVAKALRFPRNSLVLDHGIEMEIMAPDED